MSVTKHTSNVYYKVVGDKTVGLTKKKVTHIWKVGLEYLKNEIFVHQAALLQELDSQRHHTWASYPSYQSSCC